MRRSAAMESITSEGTLRSDGLRQYARGARLDQAMVTASCLDPR